MTRSGHTMEIRSDRRDVADAIRAVAELAVAHGARIHRAAWIDERDGQLGVHAGEGATEGDPLIDVPGDLLVPVDAATWDVVGDRIVVVDPDPEWSPIQRALLAAMLEVYALTDKVAWTRRHLPWFTLHDHRDGVAQLRRLRPQLPTEQPTVADAFLRTRTLGTDGRRVLMPVIDWLDHHPSGSAFRPDDGGIGVRVRRPRRSTSCLARYHARSDPLDLALTYGYVEHDARSARTGPLRLEIDGLGRVRIEGQAPRQVHRIDPPTVRVVGDDVVISHLVLEPGRIDDLITLLSLPITAIQRQRRGVHAPNAAELSRSIIADAAKAHRELVSETIDAISARSGQQLLIDALRLHRAIVERSVGDQAHIPSGTLG